MKITFILPAIGKKRGQKYIGTWKMEPLTIAVLKALTPKEVETEFFDDRIELINYETKTDLIAISVEAYTAKRSYQIAAEFKKRGVPVILGGYHVTLLPEEAMQYCDSVIVGNAEPVWIEMLNDFRNAQLQKTYHGGASSFFKSPDKSIFYEKKYLPISLLEIGRGCNHSCEFCAISSYYKCKYIKRDHESIIQDIKASKHKYHFFVDDNLVADLENAKELFRKIIPLKIKWAGQGTLSMAKDEELLKLMKQSGCELILIGFESINEENLKQMNKYWNKKLGEVDELVQRIHKAGIGIYATFLFGYDFDTEETFEKTLSFAMKHKFYTAAFNHLLPFPGTPLYQRLDLENKLIHQKWWLDEGYHYGELAFEPASLTAEKVSNLCRQTRKKYSSFLNVLMRGFASMKRSSPVMWSLFWAMNLRLGEEIDEKFNVPIGGNLDELPK